MQVTLPRILVLEDVEDDAELMLLELRQAGLCGVSQRVWTEAAFMETASRFLPHVILADFSLPGIDGLAALEIRQQLCPDTPFIIVTGSLGEERAVSVLKAGATDYVLKHDLARLAPAVRRALAESSALRDRRRIARQLDAERRLLSAVLDRSAALIALIDTSGRLVRINAAAAEVCGVAEAQARGQHYWDLFAEPGHAAHSRQALLRLCEGRPAAPPPPWREATRSGHMILWSASLLDEPGSGGEALVLAGIDVSGQQREDEARARLATIVASSDDAILSKTLDGVITSWNHGAERIFGYTAAEAIGRNMQMLVPARYAADEQQILQRLRAGGSVSHFETVRLRKDGQEISVSTTVSPMRDAAGRVVSASTITRDISERKRLEALHLRSIELEAENRRMLEANRLKSEFLANMSHELRTPLNAVIGFADLLREGRVPPDSPKHREFLNHISNSGQHLLQLINDILDLSKVEAGKLEFFPEPVDLGRTVQEVTAILGSTAAAKQISVGKDLDPALGLLLVDPARLKQVLYNYLSNALKFTPAGGSVVVRARAEGERMFRIEVEDTGIGIPSQQLGRLFVEFEQLDAGRTKNHAGTGLGLALTRRLVEAQGGRVGVRSAPGQGSVFHAILPRVAEESGARAVHAPGRDASVLVVQDDPHDQAALISTLTSAGFEVETAASGAQAVARAREKAFSALTLDLLLPGTSGLDVLASIRREGLNRSVPVVAVTVGTARQVPSADVWGLPPLAGFAVSDLLTRPVHEDALRVALQRIGNAAQAPGPVLVLHHDHVSLQDMADTLQQIGYGAVCRDSGARALQELDALRPQAIILDLLMQDLDCVAFLGRLRQLPRWRHTPVLLWAGQELDPARHARLAASAQAALRNGQGGMDALLQDLDAMRHAQRPTTGTSHGSDARSDH
ncbi:MAG TPA: PAS domain S-box protein [Burkholderiaceae bacterium]|nr:PAS domain S-box protein [Burkholderiaceae bacterium]